MRASNFWWSSPLFFFIFRLSLAASIFVPEGLVYRDDSLISSDFEDEIHYFDNLNPDLTLLSKSDRCADNDATKSPRKRQSNPAWCTTDGKTPPQQLSSPTKGQGQDRNGWTDNKPFEGELPSQLRFLDDDPHSKAEPKPNIELCKDRGIFAVCAEDKSVGWWGQPDSMQFKLDPCTPYSPGFSCLTTEIIWCCQGIFMKATQFYQYLGFVCLPKDPKHQIPLLPKGEHM